MKKIFAVSAAIAIMATFAGCSSNVSVDSTSETEPTTAASTEAVTTAETEEQTTAAVETTTESEDAETTTEAATGSAETTTAAEPATDPAGSNTDNAEYKSIAVMLMKAMTAVEKMSSGFLTTDVNQPLESDDKYFRVTDGSIDGYNFTSMSGVKSFLNDNFSGSFYETHSYLIGGEDPFLKEDNDGNLYAKMSGREHIYSWDNYEPEIISSSDNEFTARAQFTLVSGTVQVDIHIVKYGERWLVESV